MCKIEILYFSWTKFTSIRFSDSDTIPASFGNFKRARCFRHPVQISLKFSHFNLQCKLFQDRVQHSSLPKIPKFHKCLKANDEKPNIQNHKHPYFRHLYQNTHPFKTFLYVSFRH